MEWFGGIGKLEAQSGSLGENYSKFLALFRPLSLGLSVARFFMTSR